MDERKIKKPAGGYPLRAADLTPRQLANLRREAVEAEDIVLIIACDRVSEVGMGYVEHPVLKVIEEALAERRF